MNFHCTSSVLQKKFMAEEKNENVKKANQMPKVALAELNGTVTLTAFKKFLLYCEYFSITTFLKSKGEKNNEN